jgi:broad specificity phosphatase PhoE
VHFGDAEGLTSSEMAEEFPVRLAEFRMRPASSPLPGAESGSSAVDRAWPALLDIAAVGSGPTLVVMHSTLMRLVLCRALGIPLDGYRTLFPSVLNVAATTLEWNPGQAPALLGYNVPTAK